MKTNVSKRHIHLGAINEYRAIIEFLSKGCEVFTNVKQHGCIDLVVIHPDGMILNCFLFIGLIIIILGWCIALPFLMLYDKLFGGWRKDINEEKH